MKTIGLGDIARDKMTGLEGEVVAHSTYIHNCDRLTIQPKGLKDGRPYDTRSFDILGMEFVKKGTAKVYAPVVQPVAAFGDSVKDRLTGAAGVLVSRTIWSNGCSRVSAQPTKLKDGLPADLIHLDEQDVILVKRAAVESKPAKTGGPRAEPSRR
jgi:hypothetical protein